LIRYESDPELLAKYRPWVGDLWENNWEEGNSLFTYMTLALLPEHQAVTRPGEPREASAEVPHSAEGLRLANQTLTLFPIDRVLHPVMNSLRGDIVLNERATQRPLAASPVPVNMRPLDNEYVWKGNPYELDGWLKPTVTHMAFACDDPMAAWFCDSSGRLYMTLDRGQHWRDATDSLRGAALQNVSASTTRTFVLWAQTDRGPLVSRDGGLSWREAPAEETPAFANEDFGQWHSLSAATQLRIDGDRLVRSTDGGATSEPAMEGWRIPIARSLFTTPWGIIAGGPGGYYVTDDGERWQEITFWPELETGAADFLHAYWMGRYYGFIPAEL
jgi:hypothetical protein